MKNQTAKPTDELLKNEPPVSAYGLLEELFPLMDDYFIGNISLENDKIEYRLPNGQSFDIRITPTP